MTNFFDQKHSAPELIFHSATEKTPADICDDDILAALDRWQARENIADASPTLLQLENTHSFTIDSTGETANYWADESSNLISESLVREFLFHEGLDKLSGFATRVYVARYDVLAISDTEYLLICPYPSPTGTVGGLVVVCVNQRIRAFNSAQ